MPEFTSKVETITPDQATAILESSSLVIQNRHVRDALVDFYAKQMISGEWKVNGEAIILDESGHLLDGQHRLWAVVKTGVPLVTFVSRGVPRSAMPTIDTGPSRTAGDVLGMSHLKNANHVAAAVGWIFKHQSGRMMNTARSCGFTNAKALDLVKKNPEIIEAVQWAVSARGTSAVAARCSASVMAFLRFMFDRHNPEKAKIFFDMVYDEIPNPKGTVTRLYRDWILKGEKKSQVETVFLGIKAWTLFLSGRSVQKLLWKRGGETGEAFPAFPGDSIPSRKVRKLIRRPVAVKA